MATWKRLTETDSSADKMDVNMDQVAFIARAGSDTYLHFAVGKAENFMVRPVRETPDEIHSMKPLRSSD